MSTLPAGVNVALQLPSAAVVGVAIVCSAPRVISWSSIGSPASGLPLERSARRPDTVTGAPALTVASEADIVSRAGEPVSLATCGRIDGSRA